MSRNRYGKILLQYSLLEMMIFSDLMSGLFNDRNVDSFSYRIVAKYGFYELYAKQVYSITSSLQRVNRLSDK